MFIALSTTLSLDEAKDLQEIDTYGRSWRYATHENLKARRVPEGEG
jgi:hypothetical protein